MTHKNFQLLHQSYMKIRSRITLFQHMFFSLLLDSTNCLRIDKWNLRIAKAKYIVIK